MKSFRKHQITASLAAAGVLLAAGLGAQASLQLWPGLLKATAFLAGSGHGFARWVENVESGSGVEQALYRLMQLPCGQILYRRAPSETVPALSALANSQKGAALYSLRALEEERALDFEAAERDWKTWASQADDKAAASLDLADFYERRLKPNEELAALEVVGKAQASPQERWTGAASQRSWLAWERALAVVDRYALPRSVAAKEYAAFVDHYPGEKTVYARQLSFLLDGKDFTAASALIARYRSAFTEDRVFPVKAEADLAVRRGSAADGLAVYERGFEPLWPAELVKNYFDLVAKSRAQRPMADALRAKLAANPNDWQDAARLFYLYQQQGQLDSANAVLAAYRERKDATGAAWAGDELYTFARLLEAVQNFPEAARYYYALASDNSAKTQADSPQKGIAGLARILLTAPEQPLRVGAGNLAMYKGIATMDRGPGYLNGILSLFLNTQGPESEYGTESDRAIPYFHRARAAELLAVLDKRFAQAPERAELHARLMEAYGVYGENQAIIREGTNFLAQFPTDPRRVEVALETADAYTRTHETEKEFAIYQGLLKELAAQADGIPLGSEDPAYSKPVSSQTASPAENPAKADTSAPDSTTTDTVVRPVAVVRSSQYAQVLDRYLARLVSLHRLPDALQVLRGELDHNPQDPGLYQRLADFLEQNALNSHEEEVYQSAIKQFQDPTWYAKLARYYLRLKRRADYSTLSRKVADIFSGTDLEEFLKQAPAPNSSLAVQVNRYAHQRFPHDLAFVRNLIAQGKHGSIPQAEVEQLLWQHWAEDAALRDQLFELLSRTGRLESTVAALRQQSPEIDHSDWTGLTQRNPAAGRLWMESCLWQSHYEQGVGAADALAKAYPADAQLAGEASSLYRSLAYFHPEDTDKAVAIEKQLLVSQPGNLDVMARIGDIYADRERMADAAPYFLQMAAARPGDQDGYLQSATVFWDYFDFPTALKQLRQGRERLGQPALFGYQAGAIEESQGNRPAAVREYLTSALADKASDESRERLLALARRPDLRPIIEEATAGLLKQATPSPAAIQLRVSVLDAEHRKQDLEQELKLSVAQTSSFEVLDDLTEAARSHAMQTVEELSLQRQISLTTDPVRNLQLRYQLVDLYQKRSPAAAAAEVDAIYREHGKVLGVVRSTVDYDWGHERKAQSVTTLLDAAQSAYPELKSQFQLEAARKLTELGEFARSRALLEALMSQKPLDPGYQAALAANFARAGDQAGLEAFYTAQLKVVQQAPLEHSEKTARVAELRRGMIAAATLIGNSSEAADQYIELINAYPDDASLAQEAALYAVAHGLRDRVFGYYQKTIAQSSRDARWSIVLARLATSAEEYPLAVDAYAKAIQLRPERQDLVAAQAGLYERLIRLDDAVVDYLKLYKLSYRDPQWMEKVAEARARQGRPAEAVKALETGWLDGRPPKAANFFAVAERLERWSLLDEARKYAEQGVDLAGADLLVENTAGAATYARILARQRQSDAAFTRLADARQQAAKVTISTVAQQVAKQGIAAVSDDEWRQQHAAERAKQATQGFAQALRAMARAAGEFYTPEEKTQFSVWLQAKRGTSTLDELQAVYLPAATAVGLSDLEADWRWERIQKSKEARESDLSSWIQFELRRGEAQAAAGRLEKLAPTLPVSQRSELWSNAADLYRKAGDSVGELRAISRLAENTNLKGDVLARYYQLLLTLKPLEMIQQAGSDEGAQFLILNGTTDQALTGISTHAAKLPPVWKSAYTALAGLYERQHRPEIGSAFATALGSEATIGERIDRPADRSQQLAGEVWFYYGSRYAEYLDEDPAPKIAARADDFLESELEHMPESSDAYLQLADYSANASRADAALADYQRSLDLKRDQPAVLDCIANIEWKQGRQSEALASWSEAVKRLAEEIDARRVPESFWGDFARVLKDVSAQGQYATIRADVDAMLHTYIARNGNYRSDPLLEAGYHANGDSAEWLLQTAAAASDSQSVLESAVGSGWEANRAPWLHHEQVSQIWAHIFELAERKARENPEAESYTTNQARVRWVEALIEEKKFAEARAILVQLPSNQLNSADWLQDELSVTEAEGHLDALLAKWKKAGSDAPVSEVPASDALRSARSKLSDKGSRAVMRFIYERALDARELTTPNFLGLAAIRLEDGDTTGAVELLKRMTLVADDAFSGMSAAGALLEEHQKPAEALQFLRPLTQASPWNASYRVRLAVATLGVQPKSAEAIGALSTVVADPKAPYRDRVAAAQALNSQDLANPPQTGSGELSLLAGAACPTVDMAAKPGFVDARMAAASCAKDPKASERLLRDALAIAPANAQLRLQYIWSAFEAGSDSRALIAAEPLLQQWGEYGASWQMAGGDADDSANQDFAGNRSSYSGPNDQSQTLTISSLKPEDARKLFSLAERANEKRQDLAEALRILRMAQPWEKNPKQQQTLLDMKKRLQLELARIEENDARAPHIHTDLDQDRVVRPRLLSGMPFTPTKSSRDEEEE